MKKIAVSLLVLSILLGQNTSAAAIDQKPQTTKPAYEKITVPDQDLNNTNTPILYRYKITAPSSGPLTISGETIEIQAVGVVPQTINLKVFSDKDFKKEIQKTSVKFDINLGKQKLNFAFKQSLKVKAGTSVFVQIDTAIKGNKDIAYITTKPIGLSETTIKTKPISKPIPPKITYVQAKAADKNEVFSEEEPMLYGQNITKDTQVYILLNGVKKYFDGGTIQSNGVTFITPKRGVIPNGTYQLFAENGRSVSNGIKITYKNQIELAPSIKVVSPNGGETFTLGEQDFDFKVKWQSQNYTGPVYVYLNEEDGSMCLIGSVSNASVGSYNTNLKLGHECKNTSKKIVAGKYLVKIIGDTGEGQDVSNVRDSSDTYFSIAEATTSSDSCTFTRNLTLGSSGADVVNLQVFLQTRGFLGTSGEDKGYFGVATQAALAKYQASIGISPANGYFGVMTRVKVTADCASKKDIIIENISSEVRSIGYDNRDNVAEYSFSFDVTSTEKDIFIKSNTKLFDIWSGVTYEVIDDFGNVVKRGTYTTSGVLISTALTLGDYFIVPEGVTREFNPQIIVDNVEKSGRYKVRLMNLGYLNAPTSAPPFLEIPLNYESNFIYIESNKPITSKTVSSNYASNSKMFPAIDLESGATHELVKTLQKYLNENGYVIESLQGEPGSKGYESDYFGEKTKQALIKFQTDKGISPAQGYFGPKTRAAMGI